MIYEEFYSKMEHLINGGLETEVNNTQLSDLDSSVAKCWLVDRSKLHHVVPTEPRLPPTSQKSEDENTKTKIFHGK